MTRQNMDIMFEQKVDELTEQAKSDAYNDAGVQELRVVLREMRVGGFAPTKASTTQIIKSFLRAEDATSLWEFLEYLNELGWKITTRDAEAILRMLWKQDSVIEIADLHEKLTKRKPLTKQYADIALALYVRMADYQAAEKVLLRMKVQKLRADGVTYYAMTGMKYDPKRPGSFKATITSIMGAVRSKQKILSASRSPSSSVATASAPPTDKDRRVLRNVLKSLTTTEGELSSDPDKASSEYTSALRLWQEKNLPQVKKILRLPSDDDNDDTDYDEPLLAGKSYHSELDNLLTLAFIAPRFWRPGTSATTRASTIRHALGVVDVDYNRLEWLGDSVLELLVRQHLMKLRPGSDEGQLTQIASAIVSSQACDAMLRCLRLDRYIMQGGSTLKDPEVEKLNADVLESLLGSLMIGAGYEETRRVFQTVLLPTVTGEAEKLLSYFPVNDRTRAYSSRRRRGPS
jgi:dsRNA-specific ribonuclease